MALEQKLRELRRALDERYEAQKPRTYGTITVVNRDSANNVVSAQATIDGVPSVSVAVPYGSPLVEGASVEVQAASGKLVGPQWELLRITQNPLAVQVDTGGTAAIPSPAWLTGLWETGVENATAGGPFSGMKAYATVRFAALDPAFYKLQSYTVQAKKSTAVDWERTTSLTAQGHASGDVLVYKFSDLEAATYYDFRVAAVNVAGGRSDYSQTSFLAAGDTVAPATPTGLTGAPIPGGVFLDWADNAENDLGGYRVYYATSSGGPWSAYKQTGTSNYTFVPSTTDTTFYFRLSAVDKSGNESGQTGTVGPFSVLESSGAGSAPTTPGTPTATWTPYVVNGTQFGRVALRWAKSTFAFGPEQYTIRRQDSVDGVTYASPSYVIASAFTSVDSTTREFVLLNLKANTYYKFAVSAFDVSGRTSGYSSDLTLLGSQTGYDSTPPANVTGLVSVEDANSPTKFFGPNLQLAWDSLTDEDLAGYVVQITDSTTPVSKEYVTTSPRFTYTYGQNAADHGGTASNSVSVAVYGLDTAQNRSLVPATGTFVNDAPSAPASLTSVEDTATDKFYSADLQVQWTPSADRDVADYRLEAYVGGVLKFTADHVSDTHFIYTFQQNRTDNGSPSPVVRIDVAERDSFGSLGAAASKTFTNPAPLNVPSFQDGVNLFRSMVFYWAPLPDPNVRDFSYNEVTVYESDDAGGTGEHVLAGFSHLPLQETGVVCNGTGGKFYRVGVKNFDLFAQTSSETFSARVQNQYVPIITPEDLAGRAYQITPTAQAGIKNAGGSADATLSDMQKLYDYDTTIVGIKTLSTTELYVQYEFPVQFTFNKTALSFVLATANCYLAYSPDGTTWTYLCGTAGHALDATDPANPKWVETSSQATAQTNYLTAAIGTTTARWPFQRQAKYIRLYLKSATSVTEWKNDVYLLADTIDAGTLNLARNITIYDDVTTQGVRIDKNGAIFQNGKISVWSATSGQRSSSTVLEGTGFKAYNSGGQNTVAILTDGSLWANTGGFGGTTLSTARIKLDGPTGNVTIDGDLIVNTGGAVRASTTTHTANTNTWSGTGFWLGNDTGTPKLMVGNPSGSRVQWDGSTLLVKGTINADAGYLGALDVTGILTVQSGGEFRAGGGAVKINTSGISITGVTDGNPGSTSTIRWLMSRTAYIVGYDFGVTTRLDVGTSFGSATQSYMRLTSDATFRQIDIEAVGQSGKNAKISLVSGSSSTASLVVNGSSSGIVTRTDVTPTRNFGPTGLGGGDQATITCSGVPSNARFVYGRLGVQSATYGAYCRVFSAAQSSAQTYDFACTAAGTTAYEEAFVMVACSNGQIKVQSANPTTVFWDTLGYSL